MKAGVAIELLSPRAAYVSDPVLEMSLHRSICTRPMRSNRTMTFRAS